MTANLQEALAERVYSNPRFQQDYNLLLSQRFLYDITDSREERHLDSHVIKRLVESALIFATSPKDIHKRISLELATSLFESEVEELPKLRDVMKLVCTRLGNIPAVDLLGEELYSLPVGLAVESEVAIAQNTVQVDGRTLRLTQTQIEAFEHLSEGISVSLSAPTSAGKSFLITNYVASRFINRDHYVAAIIVPTRALIRQMTEDFNRAFRSYNSEVSSERLSKINLVTSSNEDEGNPHSKRLFVLTQERLQAVLYNWQVVPTFDLLVIDESQNIADKKRGIILEETIAELVANQPSIQTVFLCPLASNPGFLFEVLNIHSKRRSINSTFSPVAQHIYYVETSGGKKGKFKISTLTSGGEAHLLDIETGFSIPSKKVERIAAVARFIGRGSGNILYARRPDDAVKMALAVARTESTPLSNSDDVLSTTEFLKESIHKDYYLIECLQKGVGYHFSAMPDIAKVSVEDLFKRNSISYIACTSTLLQGVNLPAKNIFMDNPRLGNEPMDDSSFWNLAGRAGRLMKDLSGNVYCINPKSWRNPVSGRVKEYKIESSLSKTLNQETFTDYLKEPGPEVDRETYEQAANSLILKFIEKGAEKTEAFIKSRVPADKLKQMLDNTAMAAQSIKLPSEILKKNKSIDVRLQQRFADHLARLPYQSLVGLTPIQPFTQGFNNILREIFRLSDDIFVIEERGRRYQYFAVIASQWIHERPLRDMIISGIQYQQEKGKGKVDVNVIIFDLIQDLNKEVRFHYVKTSKCFCDLLHHEFARRDVTPENIPHADFGLATYLELGMYHKGTTQLHNLGLSRTTAIVVNEYCRQKGVPADAVLEWVKRRVYLIARELARPCGAELIKFLG
jgi:replicative superfamily II helicase